MIRTRNEIPSEYTWKLEDLYISNDIWNTDFETLKAEIQELSKLQGTLKNSPEALKHALDTESAASLISERLMVYAKLRSDEDTNNTFYQGLLDRAMAISVALSSAISFMIPEILEIDPQTLNQWLENPILTVYKHGLLDVARTRPHVLGHSEERLLAMTGEISAAPESIYSLLDNADLHFPPVVMPSDTANSPGESLPLTHGNYIQFMENVDQRVRKQAFKNLYSTYASMKNTYSALLSNSIKADVFYAKVRNYPSAREASLFSDNVPVSVYDNLIDAVHAKFPALHRYMQLKKRALQLDELHMYDLFTPLNDADYGVTYEEAQAVVIRGLAPLGQEYVNTLKEAFEARWIDVYENKGKSSGAYCWGAYGTHPYVLLNYQDNIDSMFTIAHEMGHAMHSHYSNATQEFPNSQYTIFVAEVASTVNEVLLMTHLLETETDRAKKLRLLNYYLEQFRTTVYRQVQFAEFERITHEMVENGEPITPDVLEQVFLQLNRDYYGENMVVDDEIGMEWARISHFYTAFYVYKYATGFSAAVALAKAIRENPSALDAYKTFLSSGGSDYPLMLLKRAGVDLTTPKPVLDALGEFERALAELESLV